MSLSLSNSSNVFNYNKLNRCNYYHWSESTMTALKAKGVWHIVTRTEAKPTYSAAIQKVIHTENAVLTAKQEVEKKGIDEKILEWDLRNDLALAIIAGGIEDMQKVHIQGKESAKVAWDKLKDVHQMSQLGMVKFHLREELRDLKYEEGSSMQVHIDRVVTTAQKLDELGRPVPDIEIAETLIMSLPKTPVWTVINVSLSGLNSLMSEAVKARLLIEGSREKPSDTSPPTTTMSTTTTTVERALPAVEDSRQNSGSRNGRGNGSTRGGNRSINGCNSNFNSNLHGTANRNNNSGRCSDCSNDSCNYCQNRGHWEWDCNKKKRDLEAGRDSRPGNMNLAVAVQDTLQHCTLVTSTNPHSHSEWILDSGATSHIVSNKELFMQYIPFTIPASCKDNGV